MSQAEILSHPAGRYALSLFELAREMRARKDVSRDVAVLDRLIRESAELRGFLRESRFSRVEMHTALSVIAERCAFHAISAKLLGLMAHRRRLALLPDLVRVFRRLEREEKGILAACVTSAHPLAEGQKQALATMLEKRFERSVALETDSDRSLLGGFILRLECWMVDQSVRGRLTKLRNAMKGAG